MDSQGSLNTLYGPMVEMVKRYLYLTLGSAELREAEDFDRDGVILAARKKANLEFRLFISHEFLSDFNVESGSAYLRQWKVSDKLKSLPKGSTLFVTTEGTFVERTEGETLRSVSGVFDSVIPSNEVLSALYDRVFAIPIDGVPLGDLPTEMKGDPELYTMYSDEFALFIGAAYLLDGADFRNFELRRAPATAGVDLEIRLVSGEVAFLDFKRAVNPLQLRISTMREQVNVELRRALRDNDQFSKSMSGKFIQISLPTGPIDRTQVGNVVKEIEAFVNQTSWQTFAKRTLVDFNSTEFPVLSSLGAHVYVDSGPTHISIQEGAGTVDRYAPANEVMRVLREERRKRFEVEPVWLGISVSEAAPFIRMEEIFKLVSRDIHAEPLPFQRIIVGSAGYARSF
jgi:hypothetical protein